MDVERLIQCVKKHVYLYDIAHRDYKNLTLKTLTWESIARELNSTSDAVKHKWKTVKDGYMKYRKQLKKATGCGKKVIDYIWSPRLKFLDSCHATRKSTSNVISHVALKTYPDVETNTSSPMELLMPSLQSVPSSSTANFLLVEPLQATAVTQATKRIKRKKGDTVQEPVKKIKVVDHDATDYLFLSYAQTFKKFSMRQQAILKMELARLFSNAELAELSNSDFETSNAFSFVQPVIEADGTDNIGSPNSSSSTVNSIDSNDQKTTNDNESGNLSEVKAENLFPDDFQEHIVP